MKKFLVGFLILAVPAHFLAPRSFSEVGSARPAYAASDELYFLHTDYLGSTRAVTDQNGNVVARDDYYPYGAILRQSSGQAMKQSNNEAIERLYTSQIYDQASALYFYNARYYNPALGTFISADQVQGPNRYAYVSNNPINMVDPSGNQDCCAGEQEKGIEDRADWLDHTIFSGMGISYTSEIYSLGVSAGLPFVASQTLSTPSYYFSAIIPPRLQFYRLDFMNPYFTNLGRELGASNIITGSEYEYARKLTENISKKVPYYALSAQEQTEGDPVKKAELAEKAGLERMQSKTLSNLLINERAICFEKALLLSYYLTKSGLPNEIMYLQISNPNLDQELYHSVVFATVDSQVAFLDPTLNFGSIIKNREGQSVNAQAFGPIYGAGTILRFSPILNLSGMAGLQHLFLK